MGMKPHRIGNSNDVSSKISEKSCSEGRGWWWGKGKQMGKQRQHLQINCLPGHLRQVQVVVATFPRIHLA